MSHNNNLNHAVWQIRDFELKDENIPPWKSAALHRQNLNQLYYECAAEDAFDHLLDKESMKYASIVDGKDKARGLNTYCDEVEAVVPGYKDKIGKFTSQLTFNDLMDMDCVKSALKQCESMETALSKEINSCGDYVLPKPAEKGKENPNTDQASTVLASTGRLTEKKAQTSKFKFQKKSENTISIYDAPVNVQYTDLAAERGNNSKNTFPAKDSRTNKRKLAQVDVDEESSSNAETDPGPERKFHFRTAKDQFNIDQKKKNYNQRPSPQGQGSNTSSKKSLGARPRNACFGKFIPPSIKDQKEQEENLHQSMADDEVIDPRLKTIEPKIIELVTNEIMDHGPPVQWDDIAGLEFAKTTIKEIVIWPMLRPDIFTGLRGPPKGILLFGPPGTGKTLIGKCIASQSGATFFSISASSLTSKWVGEGEKMVRALFAVASCHQPAVIFIDEIDSLLSQRCDGEHDSSRRIKTEFLVQLDGAATSSEERILVVGATNRPQEIDEAARRRLSKRLYILLPEADARKQIVERLLNEQNYELKDGELEKMISETGGYSGADMANLCREAALGPIRSLQGMDISVITKDDVRPITIQDFEKALFRVRPSVSQKDLILYEDWNKLFGCCMH